MKRTWKRMGALLLAVVMTLSLLPASALAARVEDDAIAIAAPDTAAQAAAPAGAVDAIDVPATLLEGTSTNIAKGKDVYCTGTQSGGGGPALAVDGEYGVSDGSHHWSSNKLRDASNPDAVAWIVVDLGAGTHTIDSIAMQFNMKVWPTECYLQVGGADISYEGYTSPTGEAVVKSSNYTAGERDALNGTGWVTVAKFTKESSDDGASNTNNVYMGTEIETTDTSADTNKLIKIAPRESTVLESEQASGTVAAVSSLGDLDIDVKYVRAYFTGLNANAAANLGLKELIVMGTTKVDLSTLSNIALGKTPKLANENRTTDGNSNPISYLTDGDPNTEFEFYGNSVPTAVAPENCESSNCFMEFDFGVNRSIGGFEFAVKQSGDDHGYSYNIYGQAAGSDEWTKCVENVAISHASGQNVEQHPLTALTQFQKVRVVLHSGHAGSGSVVAYACLSEFKIYGVPGLEAPTNAAAYKLADNKVALSWAADGTGYDIYVVGNTTAVDTNNTTGKYTYEAAGAGTARYFVIPAGSDVATAVGAISVAQPPAEGLQGAADEGYIMAYNAVVKYNTHWESWPDGSQYIGSEIKYKNAAAGDVVTVPFIGTGIQIYGEGGSGSLKVKIDGTDYDALSFNVGSGNKLLLRTEKGLNYGLHNLTLSYNENNNKVAIEAFRVLRPYKSLTMSQTTAELEVGGDTLALTATHGDADNAPYLDDTKLGITWTSSDATVATVDSNGVVTAVGAGSATITAATADPDVKAECTVTVTGPATPPEPTWTPTAEDATHDVPLTQVRLFAGTECGTSDGTDGPASYANDENTGHWWHSNWRNDSAADVNNRWIAADLGKEMPVVALRYQSRTDKNGENVAKDYAGNGYVTEYRVEISADGESWTPVEGATGTWDGLFTVSTTDTSKATVNGGWRVAVLPAAVNTRYVRLVGVHTTGAAGADLHMHAAALRVVVNATRYSVSGVVSAASGPLAGAVVTANGQTVTTNASGEYTLEDLLDGEYTLTVGKAGYVAGSRSVTVEGANLTAQNVTLTPETYNEDNVNAGKFDVGFNGLAYSNPSNSVISATASSWETDSTTDGGPENAVDGSTGNPVWHTNYEGPADNATGNLGKNVVAQSPDNRWLKLEIKGDDLPWITGLRYHPKGNSASGNGYVSVCKVEVSNDGTNWSLVTAESAGLTTKTDNWHYIAFDAPVQAKYVKFTGVTAVGNFMNAAEVRLVKAQEQAPTTRSVTVTVTDGVNAVEGATVTAAGQSATTNASGVATLSGLVDGSTYTVKVEKTGYVSAQTTVTPSGGDATAAVTLIQPTADVQGTITTDGTTPVSGATVQLLQSAAPYALVASGYIAATTGDNGRYTLNISNVADGSYVIRVSEPGSGAKISEKVITVANHLATANNRGNDLTLPRIDNGVTYKYTFENAAEVTDFAKTSTNADAVTIAWDETAKAMKLTFVSDTSFAKNIVVNTKHVMKNGTMEFDATRTNGDGSDRFAATLQLADAGRLHVGGFDATDKYGYESYFTRTGSPWSDNNAGPEMVNGTTRHYKVTVDGTTGTLAIDGKPVWSGTFAAVGSGAGKFGFEAQGAKTYLIDNLYITRDDTKSNVTVSSDFLSTDVTQAFEGDTVTITNNNADTTKDLKGLPVVMAGTTSVTVTAVTGQPNKYTFTMPAEAVTVSGTLLIKVSGVTISGTLKVGETVTAEVTTPSDGDHVNYQWQHNQGTVAEPDWVNCSDQHGSEGSQTAAKKIGEDDYNHQIRVKVTAKADDNEYIGEAYSVPAATDIVQPADIQVDRVTVPSGDRTIYTNKDDNADNSITITASVYAATEGQTPTAGYSYKWEATEHGELVTLTGDTTATVTITANTDGTPGTAKVKCTVTRLDEATRETAEVLVKVLTLVKTVTVNTDADDLILYTNKTGGADKTLTFTAGLTPTTNSYTGSVSWDSDESTYASVNTDTGEVTALARGEAHITAKATAAGNNGVEVTSEPKTVIVRSVLKGTVTLSADAEAFGGTLSAALNGKEPADAAVKYVWTRTKDGTDTVLSETTNSYKLVKDDIDAIISVKVVPADTETYLVEDDTPITAQTTKAIEKATVTTVPGGFTPSKCTASTNDDGKIAGFDTGVSYQISTTGSTNDADWTDLDTTKLDANGVLTVSAGTWYIRLKETDTHKASPASAMIEVPEYNATNNTIAVASIDNGSLTVSVNGSTVGTAHQDDEVTITVNAATGYQLKADSLKVTGASGEVTVSSSAPYTFSMPDEAVTVTAEFEKITYQVNHCDGWEDLHILSCGEGEGHTHEVKYQEKLELTLKMVDGWKLDSVTVTYTDGTPFTGHVDVDLDAGKVTIAANVIEGNLTITPTTSKKEYKIHHELSHGTCTSNQTSGEAHTVSHGDALTNFVITAETDFHWPETITVKMGEREATATALTAGTDYTFTRSAKDGVDNVVGTIEIAAGKITNNLFITASAVKTGTPVASVTIKVDHELDSEEQNVTPHVGDKLVAVTDPTGATVDSVWTRTNKDGTTETISKPGSKEYELTANDLGATFTVKVTGTGDYTGEATSTVPTSPVAATIVLPDEVIITPTPASVVIRSTVQLTATVKPDDATETTVTWSSGDTSIATVDAATGLVTGVGIGEADITAATANGRTKVCRVTVTAKPLTSVTITGTAKVGETLTATVEPDDAVVSYQWFCDGDAILGATDQTYTPGADYAGKAVTVTVTGTEGDYAGSTKESAPSDTIAAADAQVYTITVAGDIENGTVTAPGQAAAGTTVTLTVTPVSGYKLGTITVTGTSGTAVTVRNNTFTMPEEDVAVTATFVVNTTTSRPSSSSSSTSTTKETLEDGTTVTTVTDTKTGETTVTTVTPDGGKEVVATKADGTVTTTETAPNGVVTETVAEPDKEVTATVTLPKNVEQAVVTVPVEVSPTAVAVNAETGEIIPLSMVTEDGMAVLVEEDTKLVIRDNAKDFIDVPGHWAEEAIRFTTAREIFNGTSEITFTPNGEMNRAMMVTILARFDGEDVTGGDTWYDKGAQWAVNTGISDGVNLSENITREQLVVMLYRYAQTKGYDVTADPADEAKFHDADQVSDWAQEAMQWAVSAGIIYGVGNDTLAPQTYATRAQVSTVIQRFVASLVG